MFSFLKKKEETSIEPRMWDKEILQYLEVYCENSKIKMENVMLQAITVIENYDILEITIRAGFPQKLIGHKGAIAKDFAKKLSKYLNKELTLNVIM